MRILILGGAGFLGANLARKCLAEPGHEVTIMDCLEPHLHATTENLEELGDAIRFVRGDIRDEHHLAEVVPGQDVIFNCAAQTSHPLSIQHPLLDAEINCIGNLKVLETVRLLNREAVLVYASSSTVIGKALNEVVDEDHWERPLDIYSANKSVVEKYHRIYHTIYDLKTVVLRFANLFGPYGKGHPEFGVINYFIDLAWKNKDITIYGDGQQMRNALFAYDACEAMWTAAHSPELIGETWFVAGDEHLSVLDIAQTVVKELGRGAIKHVEWPELRRRIEIENVRFSYDRLHQATGWQPQHTLETGLREVRRILEG